MTTPIITNRITITMMSMGTSMVTHTSTIMGMSTRISMLIT